MRSPSNLPRQAFAAPCRVLSPEIHWAIADAAAAQAFGDITAVPTLFLFDRAGKTARVLYGAPPDLHEEVGKLLTALTAR